MLDNEPTGAEGNETPGAAEHTLPAETPARTRRRRVATSATTSPAPTDPTLPTDAAAPSTDQPTATGARAKAPRKRAPRKATAAQAGAAQEAAAQAAADTPAEPATGARPERAADTSQESAEPSAPAKRTRARRSASGPAGAPAAAETTAAGDVAAAVEAATVAEAGDPAPVKRTRSRRVAKAPAGSPAHMEPIEPSGPTGPTGPTMAPPAAVDAPAAAEAPPARRRRSRATRSADQPAEIADTHAADAAGAPAGAAATAGAGAIAGTPGTAGTAETAPTSATSGTAGTAETSEPAVASPFTETAEPTRRTRRRATAPETSPPPAAVMFVAPAEAETEAPTRRRRTRAAEEPAQPSQPTQSDQPAEAAEETAADTQPRRRRRTRAAAEEQPVPEPEATEPEEAEEPEDTAEDADGSGDRRRRRRGRRGRGRSRTNGEAEDTSDDAEQNAEQSTDEAEADDAEEGDERPSSRRRRRRRRRGGGGAESDEPADDDPPDTVVHVRDSGRQAKASTDDEVRAVRGSTRLEAKRQRRREGRDTGRRRAPILTEAEFLARREAVDRVMVVRQRGDRTQIAVLEDDILVEHYVTKASSTSYAGNVYLGRVQNVLPSMEAAFVDIGKGRNAVLYAGEVNWDVAGLEGRARSIEHALKSGDNVLVQVTKDPIGHKGARLTSQVSLPGRFLVYVPNGSMTGISRKLPDTERARLKDILRRIVPDDAGVIIRTAAEGASEEELTRDVERLKAQWETIQRKAAQTKSAPTLLYAEPDLELRVVRDVFNEDFTKLIVSGDGAWEMISQYVDHVAPDLLPRLQRWTGDGDAFHDLRIEEQLLKGLDRKVWLPSGGSLVIDRTEAMTVIDVNTGKFVGQGGNLEQTVTRNNLEAAEEIGRQLRLRDIGGIIVIDFIDMVLESNRDLVLRRLTECLGRDRTKHQVAEVTSLGLVQMTRKRVGQGLLEAFSEPCPTCGGRGVLVHTEPVDDSRKKAAESAPRAGRRGRRATVADAGPPTPATPAMLATRGPQPTPEEVDVASEDHRVADEAVDTVEAVEPEADVTVRAESEPAGIGELPPAVPDPNAGSPNAREPVPDPDAPTPPGPAPTGAAPEAAGAAREPGGAPREPGGAPREPAGAPREPAGVGVADATTADAASAGGGIAGAEAAASAPAAALTSEPAGAEAAATASSGAGGGRRRGRRRAESAAGSPPPADVPAGPLETVGSVTDGGRPAPAARPESPDGGTAPDGSEPVAGSNGVVAPGTDTAGFPSAPEPVAGSNGTVGADGNGRTPRRRRRAASRPAGPPQPVSGE